VCAQVIFGVQTARQMSLIQIALLVYPYSYFMEPEGIENKDFIKRLAF
jgi:hypothetical protein